MAAPRLVVITGKGGVGKTTVAAAVARAIAAGGSTVLLLEVDPRESAHEILGVPPSGGELVEGGAGSENRPGSVFVQNLRPRAVVDAVVRDRIGFRVVARRVQRSPVYRHFVEGAPGLRPLVILGYAAARADAPPEGFERVAARFGGDVGTVDTVILDAPATGHGVALLEAPLLVARTIGGGPFAEMAADISGLVEDPASCGIALVTAAEEMAVQETLELRDALRERAGRHPDMILVNAVYPPAPGLAPVASDANGSVGDLWRRRRAINEMQMGRIAEAWSGPLRTIPLLPIERGPELARAVEDRLRAAADEGSAGRGSSWPSWWPPRAS